jgi:hypothetical protein
VWRTHPVGTDVCALCRSLGDRGSVSIDLGIPNTFQEVGESARMEFMKSERTDCIERA